MSDMPKVLLVENDEAEQYRLQFAARGSLNLQVVGDPMTAINRVGMEDFDMVVVDPDVDSLLVTEKLLEFLLRLKANVFVLQKENGNGKQLSASGRMRAAMLSRQDFVQSVLSDFEHRRMAV